MNKILIVNDEIIEQQTDNTLKITTTSKDDFISVNAIKIKVIANTNLTVEYTSTKEAKLEIYFNIEPGVTCNLYENKISGQYKLSYKYYLNEKSRLNLFKINDTTQIKELLIFNLNGKDAKLNYTLKTISKSDEKYDLMVYHNQPNTESLIINNGVNIKNGTLKFHVSGFVPNGHKGCILNQNNQIINLTNNFCQIKPNLFIDENDVIANHSAHIGKCNDQEMFYLMTRGLSAKKAQNLLIKGFLMKGLNNYEKEMEKIISKYWR